MSKSNGDRADSNPKQCAECGKQILSWFSTNELLPKVFCADHHRFGGLWNKGE